MIDYAIGRWPEHVEMTLEGANKTVKKFEALVATINRFELHEFDEDILVRINNIRMALNEKILKH